MAIPYHTHNFELPIADEADIQAGVATDKIVVPATLGTAATKNASAFATAAQGAKADAAAPATRQVIAGTGLQGGGALTDNVTLGLTSDVQAAITMAANSPSGDNQIRVGSPWLWGGGYLDEDLIEIEMSTVGQAALEAALTAVQPGGLGTLATKNTVAVTEIAASGTRNNTTFLRGDGVWAVPAAGSGAPPFNGGVITGEINSRSINGYRLSAGSDNTRAAILHKNETDFYILVTDAGQRDGVFNTLRPFRIFLDTGKVRMGHGLDVASGDIKAINGGIYSGSAEFHNNGNIVGTVWNNWGANNAFTATSNRIEARARAYSAENLIINGDFRIDQRQGNGSVTQNLWGYDRWLNISAGRQQYIEKVRDGIYALFWQGGGNGTLGTSSGGSPRVFTHNATGQNLRVVVPFHASNVCVIKIPSTNDLPSLNPFSPRDFGQELQLCQRYYQKSWDYAVAPSTPTSEAIVLPVILTEGTSDLSAGKVRTWFYFPQRMARPPSLAFFVKEGANGLGRLDDEGQAMAVTIPQVPFVNETMCVITNGTSMTQGTFYYEFNYTAEAEII